MIRHSVYLRFNSDISEQLKIELYERLAGLKDHIKGISDFQFRKNISVEAPLLRGFLDMFWFDFEDEMVRDIYLSDPKHLEIGSDIVAHLEGGIDGVFVCDVEV